jgi:predicted ATPase
MKSESRLLEREGDLAVVAAALDGVSEGGALLILGPAGVGKTTLLEELAERAAVGGDRVLRARGSEMERDFGFTVVRQLVGPLLRTASAAERQRLFEGPAELAAPVLGFGDGDFQGGAESSLYGLFWLVAALADQTPLVLVIDDAHWSDVASLRFVSYLAARLDGLPILLVLATRPDEPGVGAELLRGLAAELEIRTIRPEPLSGSATATLVRGALGSAVSEEVAAACQEATGGNPFLIAELLQELAAEDVEGKVSVDRIATRGRGGSPSPSPRAPAGSGPWRSS